jgi:hypothetical protein
MIAFVVGQTINGRHWWWFFTKPFVYSVYWQPDGSKTMEEFALEQAAKCREHLGRETR